MYKARSHKGWCGPISLSIVYKLYGKKIFRGRIAKNIRMTKKGTTCAELGIHALRRGFNICLYTAYWRLSLKGKTQKEAREYVQGRKNRLGFFGRWRLPLFLESGGKIKAGIEMNRRLVRTLLNKYAPVIFNVAAGVYVRALGIDSSRRKRRHFTVGVGLAGQYVLLYDPTWGELRVPLDILVKSLQEHGKGSPGGNVIVIMPKSVAT